MEAQCGGGVGFATHCRLCLYLAFEALGDQSEWGAFKSPASTIAELGRLILDRQSSSLGGH